MSEECITMADIDTANMHTYLKKKVFSRVNIKVMQVVCLGSQKIFMLDDGCDKIRMEHYINCCMLELARIFDERE